MNKPLNMKLIYALLVANYSNSVIAPSDVNRFKYELCSIIFQYAPAWQKELEVQKQIRKLGVADFQAGATNIVNNAQNPSSAPTTQTVEELMYINAQNVSKTKRSLADGYALMLSLLKEDVTQPFINRFKKLFLTIVEPERPLWYVTYPDDATTDEGNIWDGATMTRNFRNMYFSQIFPDFDTFNEFWNSTPFPDALTMEE